jgi:hypothetical protein
MANLDGTWVYQSFRPSMAPPSPLVPWSAAAKLAVTTDATGKVEGKLTIPLPPEKPVPELVMAISGSITPAVTTPFGPIPEGVRLTAKCNLGGGRVSVNDLVGYFVAGGASPVIVGTIRAIQDDPGEQQDGTSGPFVLFPADGSSQSANVGSYEPSRRK